MAELNEGKTLKLLNDAIAKIDRVKESIELDTTNEDNLNKAIDDIINVIEINKKVKQILGNSL